MQGTIEIRWLGVEGVVFRRPSVVLTKEQLECARDVVEDRRQGFFMKISQKQNKI